MTTLNKIVLFCLTLTVTTITTLTAAEFTISSYNAGGLSDHYDYLRAAAMQKLMQERYLAEPENMAMNEKIQKLALKILFSKDPQEKSSAEQEWRQKGYQQIFERLTASPQEINSPNTLWHEKVDSLITNYKIRPVTIHDTEVRQMLDDHIQDMTKHGDEDTLQHVEETRAIMAKRIFAHQLKYDIICLQEADYLDASMFPDNYVFSFADTSHSRNGIAWNKNRFDLVTEIGDIQGRAFALELLDKTTGKTILVASGHFSGSNPYRVEINPDTGVADSEKGDSELRTVVDLFENTDSDIKLIGMDSNVTSLHPRLNILQQMDYQLDDENFLDPTCANPHQVLNTRIDWIALKTNGKVNASVVNVPVLNVSLNSIQTNISDHKPIAAKVQY